MKLELKVLDTLQPYCARPDGEYPAPADVLTLGPPDLPVESIKVKSSQSQLAGKTYPFKMVLWNYPYKRLTLDFKSGQQQRAGYLHCKQWFKTRDELYFEARASIMNGTRSKELFDCKRGLTGTFLHDHDDTTKVITSFVQPDTLRSRYYLKVCYRVMHEWPYEPE
jgi:hypothetical protein